MSKIRSDSIWNSLPPEQRKMLEHWLFVERIGYKEASERAQKEWGVTGSETSVGRFYRRIEKERMVSELEEAAETAVELNAAEGKVESMRSSAMKVVGMRLLENAMVRGDVKELATLGRVLTQSEEREIQRGRLALAREKFEFKAAKAALKQLPSLDQMKQEDEAREDARIDAIRLAIFGKDPVDECDPSQSG
jgi:Arc/MetJ family transcription regulator